MSGPKSLAKPYQYRALETQNTFRLLSLHRGTGTSKLECTLQHHSLASDISFRALSYTWGQDAARHNLHISGTDSVIPVRENLRNALRSLRRPDSECLLWIDAVCINQDSNEERNHQVQLMNQIYGNANSVVVWLESAGEKARDVARAFKFVHAAAKYGSDPRRSVWHYCQKHPTEKEKNWHVVQSLCRLRYWTRKWIIQELVSAQSVVLRSGKTQCPMTDFEKFCRELDQNKDNEAYKTLSSRGGVARLVTQSPAAVLALQRSGERSSSTTRWLFELVERYAGNQCKLPEDHVYALWSLVGDHNRHLSVDYNATPMQRMVAVVSFVTTHEPIPQAKILEFAFLLCRLFHITPDQLESGQSLSARVNLIVPTTILGTVLSQQEQETNTSIALRNTIQPLPPMPTFTFVTLHDPWAWSFRDLPAANEVPVGRDDMTYFRLSRTSIYGLATCRLEAGDVIWHFARTQLVFVVREDQSHGDRRATIRGRAFLFAPNENQRLDHWRPDGQVAGSRERNLSLTLAMLLELGSLASSVSTDTSNVAAEKEKTSGGARIDWYWIDDVEAAFKEKRRQKLVTAVFAIIFFLMLTVVLLQAIAPKSSSS